jgi:hypothetical protein
MGTSCKIRRWAKTWWRVATLAGVGALLMVPVWHLSTYRSRRVYRELNALNGMARAEYTIDLGGPGKRLEFGPLRHVYLLGPATDDDKLAVLEDAPGLRSLTLTNTRVTDEGLARLAHFRDLNSLHLGNIDYIKLVGPRGAPLNTPQLASGKGLGALKDLPNLQQIGLAGQATTDADLDGLVQLKHLLLLDLGDTRVTDAGFARLKEALPKCIIRRR